MKVDPDRWEFAAEGFLRGQKELLKTIRRRRPQSSPSGTPALQQQQQGQQQEACLEVGHFGPEGEVQRLHRDKGTLIAEVVKLRQEQQVTRAQMQEMEARLAATEQKQQQMTVFLARAMKSPSFLQMLVERQDQSRRKELADALLSKKRGRPIEYLLRRNGETSYSAPAQGYGPGLADGGEGRRADGEDTESFWKELLSLGLEERHREAGGAGGDASGAEVDNDVEDEVDELVQSLYHLSPNRPHSYQ
ncbi:unnamed protein product [Triticum turgidum subsp. durum]|uniref:Uncharacterized protein n=1 Tax=Triticum turgidum subsp. durum TaxID=4567 RepID=A0A9R0XH09_TRITD|nr:unnamed protein product [Triticum turgidum subsp. durum]